MPSQSHDSKEMTGIAFCSPIATQVHRPFPYPHTASYLTTTSPECTLPGDLDAGLRTSLLSSHSSDWAGKKTLGGPVAGGEQINCRGSAPTPQGIEQIAVAHKQYRSASHFTSHTHTHTHHLHPSRHPHIPLR